MDRRQLLTLTALLFDGTVVRSACAEVNAPAETEAQSNGRALAAKVQQSYGVPPAFRLYFRDRGFEWAEPGYIDAARARVSVVWKQGLKTLLDTTTARSFDKRDVLIHEARLADSQFHLLAACLGGLTHFHDEFILERGDEQMLHFAPDLLALQTKPRADAGDRWMLLLVDARSYRLRRAHLLERGGARHRLEFTRFEHPKRPGKPPW